MICDWCEQTIRTGEEVVQVPRESASGARPSAVWHRVCPRHRSPDPIRLPGAPSPARPSQTT